MAAPAGPTHFTWYNTVVGTSGLHPAFNRTRDSYDYHFMRWCLRPWNYFEHKLEYLHDGGVVMGCMHPGGCGEVEDWPIENVDSCLHHYVYYLRYRRVTVTTFVDNMVHGICYLYREALFDQYDISPPPGQEAVSITYLLQLLAFEMTGEGCQENIITWRGEEASFSAWLIACPYADARGVFAAVVNRLHAAGYCVMPYAVQ